MSTPAWLTRIASVESVDDEAGNPVIARHAPDGTVVRPASVLVLFGGRPDSLELPSDASVLLTQRASSLRQHRGQVAFPGGAADPGDDGPVGTALREAQEETGVDPSGVEVLTVLESIFVPPSGFEVTPVVAYWRTPSAVAVVDTGETERVVAVPLTDLLDPSNRFVVRHPMGYRGPAFAVEGMLVWGFTAGVLSGVLETAGWSAPWDNGDVRDLETALAAVGEELHP
ncbi:NUDIX hydrolase [Rhodococcus sp. Leaf7]|uniref:NUDIX hydrolase n=1 Tax=unclassified Rhodococcus (in: high G+C Gram-positive bacteria) TaxID=192944 RepID=UPI0005B74E8A|nr:NUDIX hydrolase [Rhodococcus sp. MEB064]KQU07512.1 NUDIX hydrolase [Rhodococcus sp. Leaf7]KQU43033.1 NUDIX hydrolase [Rhodococcus sp. Leaf247]